MDRQSWGAIAPKLQTENLSKRYGTVTVLEPTTLSIPAGEFLTLLGPSGSGKTTLLQMISGLVEPSEGRLLMDGEDHTFRPPHQRDMGMVFQHYALFPHLTVEENVGFPLKMRKHGKNAVAGKVRDALEMVQMGHLGARFPRELSGGQQQRVALARCFVYQPSVILMDEPLGALDKKLREHMQIEIKRLHRQSGATIIYVTHDQEEALALSDRICLMNHARVEQIGRPEEIYNKPRTTFAADFVGISNVFRGRLHYGENGGGRLVTAHGEFAVMGQKGAAGLASLVVRPEHLTLNGDGENQVRGQIVETVYAGSETRVIVAVGENCNVIVRVPPNRPLPELGASVSATWRPESAVVLEAE
jgi:putative spermidine/putrescine transport system ATP-binding protein